MGQEIGVTPLQLITAVSAIANDGVMPRPHVVKSVMSGERLIASDRGAAGEGKRVIRAETAATLRRLMEGVVLNGTGPLARLDGWTTAGKTGSAQKIDPATGRYSPTQLIASFTGFAPINKPAVTILVSLDSPVGLHEGGQVAAPVFKRIAEQVLAYLDVPRDVPLNPRLIQASYKKRMANEVALLEDFSPTDFSGQPEEPVEASNLVEAKNSRNPSREAVHAPEVTLAADEAGEITVPDFSGKTMREVTELCLHLGLEPQLVGSNLAVQQYPDAGAKLRRGAKVTVQFGTPAATPEHVTKRHAASSGHARSRR
jgi:membrane peptidoglycan carboxypeptidase